MHGFRGLKNVFAKTITVGKGRAFLVNSAVDAPAEVFGEITIDIAVDHANLPVKVDLDFG